MTESLTAGVKLIGIPNIFASHYQKELERWIREYQKIGPVFSIWLNVDILGPSVIGDGSTPPLVPTINRAELVGHVVRTQRSLILVVRPKTQRDAKLIIRHTEDLEDYYSRDPSQQWGGMGRGLRNV